jgi:hypothetical protein
VYINEAIHSLNKIMPHPQQMKKDAQKVAEKMNSKTFKIILREDYKQLTQKKECARTWSGTRTCQPLDPLATV